MDDKQVSALLETLASDQLHEFETSQAAFDLHESMCEYEKKRIDAIRAEIKTLKQEARRLEEMIRPPAELFSLLEISRAAAFAAEVFSTVMSGRKTVFQPHIASESHRTLNDILSGHVGLYTRRVEAILKTAAGPGVIPSVMQRMERIRGGALLVTAEDDVVVKTSNEDDQFTIEADCFFGVSSEIEEGIRFGDFYLFN